MRMHPKAQISRRSTFEIGHTALSATESLWLRSSYAARALSERTTLGLPRGSF